MDHVTLDEHHISLNCEADTRKIATDLALAAKPGDLITLEGDLGAGKSVFAREFIRRYLDMPQLEIPSPTYLISLEYENTNALAITHMDLYRLTDPHEIDELALDEALDRGVVLIEWPQNAGDILPPADLQLTFDITGNDTRKLTLNIPSDLASKYLRSLEISRFIKHAWPGETVRKPFAADASARNYERVENQNEIRLLMDAPCVSDGPVVRDGKTYSQIARLARRVKPFIAISNLLRTHGINAPQIYAGDLESGLVLLQHLGEGKITGKNNSPIPERYFDSARLLALMHEINWPQDVTVADNESYTIPDYDPAAMMIEVQLLTQWYLSSDTGNSVDKSIIDEFNDIWTGYCLKAQTFEKSIVLRDYHSPNIIWSEGNSLYERIGVIDFQDALMGPAAYDLVSLAQDARINISPELENEIVHEYLDARLSKNPDFDADNFRVEYAMMGAQRASKVLGIFVRLNKRDAKPQYLSLLPTIRDYLNRNLQHPELSAYRNWCERVIKP